MELPYTGEDLRADVTWLPNIDIAADLQVGGVTKEADRGVIWLCWDHLGGSPSTEPTDEPTDEPPSSKLQIIATNTFAQMRLRQAILVQAR